MRDGRYQFRRYDDPFRQLLRSVPAAMSRTHHLPNVLFHGTCDAEASHYAQTTSEVTGFDPISIYTINFNVSMIYDRSRESDILPKKGCFNLKNNYILPINELAKQKIKEKRKSVEAN